jgi:hypothetical protein
MRTNRIILSSAACLALPYFSHYLIKCTIFGKKLLNIKCVFWYFLKHFPFYPYTYHQYWVVKVNPIIFHEGMGRGGIEAYFYPSLISAPDEVGGRHALAALPPGTRHFFHFTGDWTDLENLTRTGVRTPSRPAHSEPLYRLHYSGSPYWIVSLSKKIISSTFKFTTLIWAATISLERNMRSYVNIRTYSFLW